MKPDVSGHVLRPVSMVVGARDDVGVIYGDGDA